MRYQVGNRVKGVEDWSYYLELDEQSAEFYLVTERFGLGDDHDERKVLLRDAKNSRGYNFAIQFLKEKLGPSTA